MKAINLFNHWVELGKDEGMKVNHTPSVNYMLDLIPRNILESKFSFLDIGCGNGWVVKKMSSFNNCVRAVGLDGAEKMIKKAILKDEKSEYLVLDINEIKHYHESFDIVFSMEVFYYLNNPHTTLNYIFNNLLNKDGVFMMGVDHYLENQQSLSWPKDLNVHMHTYSISEWEGCMKAAGFSDISSFQFGKKNDWEGTLILFGTKL